MGVVVTVMVRLLSEGDGGLPLHTPPVYPLTLHIGLPPGPHVSHAADTFLALDPMTHADPIHRQ
jgi:hypothetical protein